MKQILLMIAVVGLNLPPFASSTFIGKINESYRWDEPLGTNSGLHRGEASGGGGVA